LPQNFKYCRLNIECIISLESSQTCYVSKKNEVTGPVAFMGRELVQTGFGGKV